MYEKPIVEVLELEVDDVVRTSPVNNGGIGDTNGTANPF